MERKKKRWLLGCGLLAAVLGLSALGVLAWLGWAVHSARTKPGPIIEVVTYYPGMPASSIEKTITNRIERWCNQSPGAQQVVSKSMPGVSIVRIYFRNDIDPNGALTMTGQLALSALPTLPPNTLPPVVLPHSSSRPVGVLAVHGTAASEGELKDMARIEVRPWLGAIKSAAVPVVLGGKDRTVVVYLKPAEMKARHLSAADVVEAIKNDNKMAALGIAYFGDNQLLIDSNMAADNIKELMDLLIRAEPGNNVFLRDIGRVEGPHESQSVRFRIDGQRAVGLPVYHQIGAAPETVRDTVSKMLALWKERMPQKIELRWVPFGTENKGWWSSDDGLLAIYLRCPSNARLEDTEKRVAAVERLIEKSVPANERTAILSELGMAPDWSAAWTANAGPMDATLYVQLSRERTLSATAYASKLRRLLRDEADFANLGIRFASHDMPAPVKVRIAGGKHEEGLRLAQEIRRRLANIKGAVDVDIAQRMDAPYLLVTVDRKKAAAVGLSAQDVFRQILAPFQPHVPLDRNFWIDVKSSDGPSISVPFSTDAEAKLEDALKATAAGANAEQPIKLSSLATSRRTTGAVEIDHDSLQRVLDVRANIEDRDRRDVIADIRKMLGELKPPEGVRVELVE